MPLELRADDEPIESVILGLAIPDADERLLELLLDGPEVVLHAGRRKAEVADANRTFCAQRLNLVRNFRLHLEAHVLEARHDFGQRHRRTGMNDLEVKLPLILTAMAIEIRLQLAGRKHFLDMRNVVKRRLGGEPFRVRHRKRFLVATMQLDAGLFPILLNQGLQQPIAPRPSGLGEIGLDAFDVDVRNAARFCANHEESAGERRIGDVVVDRGVASLERFLQNQSRAIFEIRSVAIARHEDVARHESIEHVLAREERHAMPLLQKQNSARDVEEVRIGDLKEFVARKSLEDLDQRLAVVASRIESSAVQHALELQP